MSFKKIISLLVLVLFISGALNEFTYCALPEINKKIDLEVSSFLPLQLGKTIQTFGDTGLMSLELASKFQTNELNEIFKQMDERIIDIGNNLQDLSIKDTEKGIEIVYKLKKGDEILQKYEKPKRDKEKIYNTTYRLKEDVLITDEPRMIALRSSVTRTFRDTHEITESLNLLGMLKNVEEVLHHNFSRVKNYIDKKMMEKSWNVRYVDPKLNSKKINDENDDKLHVWLEQSGKNKIYFITLAMMKLLVDIFIADKTKSKSRFKSLFDEIIETAGVEYYNIVQEGMKQDDANKKAISEAKPILQKFMFKFASFQKDRSQKQYAEDIEYILDDNITFDKTHAVQFIKNDEEETEYAKTIREGDALFIKGKFNKAKEKYLDAIKLDSSNEKQLNNLGKKFSDKGSEIEDKRLHRYAIEIYDAVIKKIGKKRVKYVWFGKAVAHGRLEEYNESIRNYKKSIEKNPNFIWAYNNLGVDYWNSLNFEKAFEQYKIIRNKNPELTFINKGEWTGLVLPVIFDDRFVLSLNEDMRVEWCKKIEKNAKKYKTITNPIMLYIRGYYDDARKELESLINKYKDSQELKNYLIVCIYNICDCNLVKFKDEMLRLKNTYNISFNDEENEKLFSDKRTIVSDYIEKLELENSEYIKGLIQLVSAADRNKEGHKTKIKKMEKDIMTSIKTAKEYFLSAEVQDLEDIIKGNKEYIKKIQKDTSITFLQVDNYINSVNRRYSEIKKRIDTTVDEIQKRKKEKADNVSNKNTLITNLITIIGAIGSIITAICTMAGLSSSTLALLIVSISLTMVVFVMNIINIFLKPDKKTLTYVEFFVFLSLIALTIVSVATLETAYLLIPLITGQFIFVFKVISSIYELSQTNKYDIGEKEARTIFKCIKFPKMNNLQWNVIKLTLLALINTIAVFVSIAVVIGMALPFAAPLDWIVLTAIIVPVIVLVCFYAYYGKHISDLKKEIAALKPITELHKGAFKDILENMQEGLKILLQKIGDKTTDALVQLTKYIEVKRNKSEITPDDMLEILQKAKINTNEYDNYVQAVKSELNKSDNIAVENVFIFDIPYKDDKTYLGAFIFGKTLYIAKWLLDMIKEKQISNNEVTNHEILEKTIAEIKNDEEEIIILSLLKNKYESSEMNVLKNKLKTLGVEKLEKVESIVEEVKNNKNISLKEKKIELAHRLALLKDESLDEKIRKYLFLKNTTVEKEIIKEKEKVAIDSKSQSSSSSSSMLNDDQKALEQEAENLKLKVEANIEQKKFDEAVKMQNEIIGLYEASLELGGNDNTKKLLDEARVKMKSIELEINKDDEKKYLTKDLIGVIKVFLKSGKYQDLINKYTSPSKEEEYYALAKSYEMLGNKEKSAEYYVKLGEYHEANNDFVRAENVYNKAIEVYPAGRQAYVNLSQMFAKLGKSYKAMGVLKTGKNNKAQLENEITALKLRMDLIRKNFEEEIQTITKQSKLSKEIDCFICYSWEGDIKRFLREDLVGDLNLAGIKVWVDFQALSGGGEDLIKFEEKIRQAQYVIVIETPKVKQGWANYRDGKQNRWVAFELEVMTNRFNDKDKNETIIPLMYKGDIYTSIPWMLEGAVSKDYTDKEAYFRETLRMIAKMYKVDSSSSIERFEEYRKKMLVDKITDKDKLQLEEWKNKKSKEKDKIVISPIQNAPKDSQPVEMYKVPEKNKLFSGREQELELLTKIFFKEEFKKQIIVEKSELSKTGKTELAKAFIYRNIKKYKKIIWLRGETEELLKEDIKEFCQSKGKKIEDFRTMLEQETQWLLVIDNVKDKEMLEKYLPKKGGHILITSSNKYWLDEKNKLELDVFTKEEAINYLQSATGQDDTESASHIAVLLANNPSSLTSAIDYIKRTGIKLNAYTAIRDTQLEEKEELLKQKINNVPIRNKNFTGRELELTRLESVLTKGAYGLININSEQRLNGIGVNQLALEYIYRNVEKYDIVWCINADNEMSIKNEFIVLADKLGVKIDEEDKENDKVIEKVIAYLEQEKTGKWLLVFQNTKNLLELQKYLPKKGGHIIVTLKTENKSASYETLNLKVFTEEESMMYVKRMINEDEKKCKKLAKMLNNIPLALAQACAYIKEQEITLEQYVKLFEDHRKLINEKDDSKCILQITFDMCVEKIEEQQKEKGRENMAQTLISVCLQKNYGEFSMSFVQEKIMEFYPQRKDKKVLDAQVTSALLKKYFILNSNNRFIDIERVEKMLLDSRYNKLIKGKYEMNRQGLKELQEDIDIVTKARGISVEQLLQKSEELKKKFIENKNVVEKVDEGEYEYEIKKFSDGMQVVFKYNAGENNPIDIEIIEAPVMDTKLLTEICGKNKLVISMITAKRKIGNLIQYFRNIVKPLYDIAKPINTLEILKYADSNREKVIENITSVRKIHMAM
jgi:hypothetical protein